MKKVKKKQVRLSMKLLWWLVSNQVIYNQDQRLVIVDFLRYVEEHVKPLPSK